MRMAQVMTLREENEAMMDTLVRTKVELAETQGVRPLGFLPSQHDSVWHLLLKQCCEHDRTLPFSTE